MSETQKEREERHRKECAIERMRWRASRILSKHGKDSEAGKIALRFLVASKKGKMPPDWLFQKVWRLWLDEFYADAESNELEVLE